MSITMHRPDGTRRVLPFAKSSALGEGLDLHAFRAPYAGGWSLAGTRREEPVIVRVTAEVHAGAGLPWDAVGAEVNAVIADAQVATFVQTSLGAWEVHALRESVPQAIRRGWRIDLAWIAGREHVRLLTNTGARLVTNTGAGLLVPTSSP